MSQMTEKEARALLKAADDFAHAVVMTCACDQTVVDTTYHAVQAFKAHVRETYAADKLREEAYDPEATNG